MFDRLRLFGTRASILWGYRPVATLRSWSIVKLRGVWTLKADASQLDAFQLTQRPLRFTAPRKGGFWSWPVERLERTGATSLTAQLGQPEQ